jgi:hypothetical protein
MITSFAGSFAANVLGLFFFFLFFLRFSIFSVLPILGSPFLEHQTVIIFPLLDLS